jgi:membrane protein
MVVEGLEAFIDDGALSHGAAIAFYGVTAIAPTMFIAVTVASLAFGRDEARHTILQYFNHLMSKESLDIFRLAIRNAPGSGGSLWSGLIGVVTLILTASGVFGEMEDALNVIWRAPPKGSLLIRLLRGRAVSLALVIGLGFLLMLSMMITTVLTFLGHFIDEHSPLSQFAMWTINFGVSTTLMAVLFAAIYKVVPNKDIEWRDVGVGAVGTALLFQLGQFLLGYYFGSTSLAQPYGAAGGLIVMLFWVYYSAQVFLLGAEFTKVYARHFGSQQNELSGAAPTAPSIAQAA